ncbi:MAG TPA: TonB family protein [Candidatus Eremiobacteraceae bacterium]|nr:TonB family protein [Candidatus Eremiobacteraceae bacterium]
MFHRFQVNPFDLLGQNEIYPIPVHLSGQSEPNLTIAWNSFHQNFLSELGAFFRWTRVPKGEPQGNIFVDCRITRRIPYRAVVAAALWHVVFFIVPWPNLPMAPKHVSAFDHTELTWSGPVDDLPLLNVPKRAQRSPAPKPTPRQTPAESTDAFHPRQRIFTDPSQPTHPRQTLVNSAAPVEPPKFLPPLPNMVQLATPSAPARPRLEISQEALAKLHPKRTKRIATTDSPPPDVPNMETRPADMSLAQLADSPIKPQLDINAGSAPRVAMTNQAGDVAPAPDVVAGVNTGVAGPSATIIALSNAPAPPAPVVEVPKGNLAARVAISPEGKGNGAPGGSASNAGDPSAKSPVAISISGGNPKPNAGMSGLGAAGKLSLPKAPTTYKRPDPNTDDDPPERTGPPDFATLPPGAPPEQIFSSHRVYSMNVDMPNLNSVTGSWIIHFSEMHLPGAPRGTGPVSAPTPLRKVDPKYPQDLIQEHVEGEVILYGVIRADGSVDSIQLVHRLDSQLDANSIAAFSQWKFTPATKDGQPVAIEAIVHIPFRGPQRQ